jgi:hypothetical protein
MTALEMLGAVGTGVGATLGIIELWKRLRPAARLRCKAIHVPYRRDPIVHEFYEENVNNDKALGDRRVGTYWADNARRSDSRLTSYWHLEITNTGRSTLKSVHLRMSQIRGILLEGRQDTFESLEPTTPIDLGDLPPQDGRVLHVWTGNSADVFDKLTLVHDSGHASVRIYRPVHPLFVWLSSTLPVAIFILVVIAIIAAIAKLVR